MKMGITLSPLFRNTTFLFLLFSLMAFNLMQAQSNQIEWDDEEDEEEEEAEGTKKAPAGVHEEVVIWLDGKEIPLTSDVEVKREDTLSIQVRHLRPESWVAVHIEKGNVDVVKRRFQANKLGELDLEIRTGNKKVSGTAKVFYEPEKGEKKTREVKVKVI